MSKHDNLVFFDVEATNDTPMSGQMTEFGLVHYGSGETFHGVLWTNCVPDPTVPAKPVIDPVLSKRTDHRRVALDTGGWLKKVVKGRVTLVSDNPAYDFMWLACFLDQELGGSTEIIGHSARRISDFWAGLNADWSNTQKWKKYRVTPHDHNPVNDSLGNVEAFRRIAIMAQKKSEHSCAPRGISDMD